jgi:hypothetical protein
MRDNRTYGFSKADADDLIAGIGSGESTFPEQKPRSSGSGGGGGTLFQFALTADVGGGTGVGTVKPADGGDAIASGVDLHDPLNIFLSLKSGGVGFCILQGDKYYIIQARCAPEVEVTP